MRTRVPAVGRVLGYWRAERRTIFQGWVACTISSVGDLTAGLTLGAITHTLQMLPGLIVLVPAAIGMRGNIFGALGSRLGTSIHSGMFEVNRERDGVLYQNTYAVAILSVSVSVLLGVLAKTISVAFGVRTISVADFIAISIIAALISSVVLGAFTIGVAVLGNRRGWDLDSVSAPLVTAAGDIVTLPALFVGTLIVRFVWVTPAVSIAAAVAALAMVVRGFITDLPLVRRAVRESVPILTLAGAIDIVAGLVIDKRLDKFVTFPALLVLVPPFLEDVGALGGILSSRLASKLHLGALSPRRLPEGPAVLDFSLIFLLAISVFTLVGISADLVARVFGLATPGALRVVGVSLLGGFMATCAAVLLAYYSAAATYRLGLDPDNHGIPIITSSMDLIGAIAIVLALLVFGLG
jgi:mgtE-like transporter